MVLIMSDKGLIHWGKIRAHHISLVWSCCCRKSFSHWKHSFHWKLLCHWLKGLRQRHIAVVIQDPAASMLASYVLEWLTFKQVVHLLYHIIHSIRGVGFCWGCGGVRHLGLNSNSVSRYGTLPRVNKKFFHPRAITFQKHVFKLDCAPHCRM